MVQIDKSKHMSKLAKGILTHLEKFLDENKLYKSTLVAEYLIARKQRVDFAFPFLKKKVFIEVHGEQHFKAVGHWGGEEGFQKRKALDNIKKEVLDNYFADSILIEFGYKPVSYEVFLKTIGPAIALIRQGDTITEEEIEEKEIKVRDKKEKEFKTRHKKEKSRFTDDREEKKKEIKVRGERKIAKRFGG